MRTLAAVLFIAGSAALAIGLHYTPTVAEGSVMAGRLLEHLRPQGIVDVACDPRIPIGRAGAAFRCTVTFGDRRTQLVDCELDRDDTLHWKPAAAPASAIPSLSDPSGN
jgi:hypothetical protein